MNDELGKRMKERYENRFRFYLPRRTYTILRIDGRAFSSRTRHCEKPYDRNLATAMDKAALALCQDAHGVRCAYGQSDEYSFLLTDFSGRNTEAWFDGNAQKIASVAASTFTAAFNGATVLPFPPMLTFDARVFVIPDRVEVVNYFIWRQKDCEHQDEAFKNGRLISYADEGWHIEPAIWWGSAEGRPALEALVPVHGYDLEPAPDPDVQP